jgi:ATP-dependent helicase/nuclease subunit A
MSDDAARTRIETDLQACLLVEAGAGSGKTTSLINRLCAHVENGVAVEQLAAVTFTRKAAVELRERLQLALEARALAAEGPTRERLDDALDHLDRCFLGTIHAFAGRLLREQALDAGIDPAFTELDEGELERDQRRFWQRWVEQLHLDADPALGELAALGVRVRDLADTFRAVAGNPDVEWPGAPAPAPEPSVAIARLRKLLARTRALMPAFEPASGWDELQRLVRRLVYHEQTRGSERLLDAMEALEAVAGYAGNLVQNRWSDTREGKEAAKALAAEWHAFAMTGAAPLLDQWREHRYAPAMRLVRRAAAAYQSERHRAGRLGFEDLLLLAARLLRQSPGARRALGERYRHLLVDEFQDTDPLQAELCLLLASDPSQGNDWRTVRPRPGALFVVGDPKQSIYRFRRADLGIYTFVRERFREFGDVLVLTRNYRSVPAIAALVNTHFAGVFPAEASAVQAPFAEMVPNATPGEGDGVFRYLIPSPAGERARGTIRGRDAAHVGAWIREQVDAGGHPPAAFLVLTFGKPDLAEYAAAIAAHGLPVVTSGAELRQEHEIAELMTLLRLLADPGHPVLLMAVLEGIFFGLTPEQVYRARQDRIPLDIQRAPRDENDPVSRALVTLHRWWQASRRMPPDQLLDQLLDETGLLVSAASQPLGEERAGAILHLVESVRRAGHGVTDLRGMIEVIEETLASDEGAPVLRPGRDDAVRVMNLHKAKGLEADVVILAAPVAMAEREVRRHIARPDSGPATGYLQVLTAGGRRPAVLAQPPGWAGYAATESALLAAERERLLYVAATRPRRRLLVAEREDAREGVLWARLAPALDQHASLLPLAERSPGGRAALNLRLDEFMKMQGTMMARRTLRRQPGFSVASVTRALRRDQQEQRSYDLSPSAGDWEMLRRRGDAIHRILEAIGRGRRGDSLRLFAEAVAGELGLDPADATGVLVAAEAHTNHPAWQAVQGGAAEYELPVMRAEREDGVVRLTEGVIDAVVERDGAWTVYDWKSGRYDGETWDEKHARYQAQVEAYRAILRAAGLNAVGAEVVAVRGG